MSDLAKQCASQNNLNETALQHLSRIMLRRIWLPKPVYAALPLIYICLGLYASYAALFMHHWSWIIPYFLLLACVCIHAGIVTAGLRIRAYRRFKRRIAKRRGAPEDH